MSVNHETKLHVANVHSVLTYSEIHMNIQLVRFSFRCRRILKSFLNPLGLEKAKLIDQEIRHTHFHLGGKQTEKTKQTE